MHHLLKAIVPATSSPLTAYRQTEQLRLAIERFCFVNGFVLLDDISYSNDISYGPVLVDGAASASPALPTTFIEAIARVMTHPNPDPTMTDVRAALREDGILPQPFFGGI